MADMALNVLTNTNWNHVSTHENPADLISQGINPADLNDSELWWKGPSWLSLDQMEWPLREQSNVEATQSIPEERNCDRALAVTTQLDFSLLERYSSWYNLPRVTAYCLRFIKNANCKENDRTKGEFLKVWEISNASTRLLKLAQMKDFPNEFKEIERSKQVPIKGRLCALKPFTDKDGLLRVGGRPVNASIPFNQRHPIILAPNNPLTTLIIEEEHQSSMF